MKTQTYKVTGHAFVPVEIEIHVEAASADEAKEKSRAEFKRERHRCIVGNSHDETSVHSFEPLEAHPA